MDVIQFPEYILDLHALYYCLHNREYQMYSSTISGEQAFSLGASRDLVMDNLFMREFTGWTYEPNEVQVLSWL